MRGIEPPRGRKQFPASESAGFAHSGGWEAQDTRGTMIEDCADEHGVELSAIRENPNPGEFEAGGSNR